MVSVSSHPSSSVLLGELDNCAHSFFRFWPQHWTCHSPGQLSHASGEALLIFSWCLFPFRNNEHQRQPVPELVSYYKFHFGTCQWPEQSMPSGTMAGDSLGDWYFGDKLKFTHYCVEVCSGDPRETSAQNFSRFLPMCPNSMSGERVAHMGRQTM